MKDLLEYLQTHGGLSGDNIRWSVQTTGAMKTYIAVSIMFCINYKSDVCTETMYMAIPVRHMDF